MMNKKSSYTRKILLLIAIVFFCFLLPLWASDKKQGPGINIEIYPDQTINEHFCGFGAETLPWLWTKENMEMGVDDIDIRLNLERIKEMRLPITRIFVPWETWNPSVDYKTFSWDSDVMLSLYKTLDFYQKNGTKVILVTVDWLKDSPWLNEKASAGAVLELLGHLVKVKGYTCIKFWTLTNEPELTYGWLKKLPYENYVRVHKLVKEGLKKKSLPIKIIASDEVESREWFDKTVRNLSTTADIFASHAYFYPAQLFLFPDFFRERLKIIDKASLSRKHPIFFLTEFGFRGTNFGACTNGLMGDYEYGIYTAQMCIDALNSGVDGASLWCLYQIRLVHVIHPEGGKMMRIGLWAYKDKDWQPFPIFYLYRLFTKYIKSDSKVLKVQVSPSDALKAACVEKEGKYSLFVVNPTDQEKVFSVKLSFEFLNYKKYIYDKSALAISENALSLISGQNKIKGRIEDNIAAHSVILYSNLDND